jgi:CubicO group peptidase (beta-lactamase class C family)
MTTTKAPIVEIEAEPEEVGLSSLRLDRLARVMRDHVDARHMPGSTLLVGRQGKVVFYDTYGSADMESGRPLQPDTIFRIYSMTKPIVSVALMMLYEEGRFHLLDPVSKYIPELKDLKVYAGGPDSSYQTRPAAREMTVQDVLTHMAGFGSRGPGPVASVVGQIYVNAGAGGIPTMGTLADQMQKLATVPLECDPGTQWIYSLSTDVVARLCEVLSGQSLDRFLQERIFTPLGMPDTAFYVTPDKRHRLAANYRAREDLTCELVDAPPTSRFAENGTYFSGVGGLTSTIYDYLRFARMLANRGELEGVRILSPRTLAYMASNHLPGSGDLPDFKPSLPNIKPGVGFGLGFAVVRDPALAGHLCAAGEYYWSGAASTHFFISPAEDLFAVSMTQLMMSPHQLGDQLRVGVYQALVD